MKLRDLEATFIGGFAVVDGRAQWREIPTVEGAQGVMFVCPKCQNEHVIVPFNNPRNATVIPPDGLPRITHRWSFSGDTIDTLTITPSIDLSKIDAENPAHEGRCYWHGWVTNGEAV